MIKEELVVIGIEESTLGGERFIQKLWEDDFSKGLYLAGVVLSGQSSS